MDDGSILQPGLFYIRRHRTSPAFQQLSGALLLCMLRTASTLVLSQPGPTGISTNHGRNGHSLDL
jgi:hypothetical protein